MANIVSHCASPLIISHRGASGYEPENTLRSFERAIELGCDMIELDVYICKSGEVVVIHDDTVDRTTNGQGKVKQFTWEQLQQLHIKKNQRIPLLSEVFDLVDKRIAIDIELKDFCAIEPVAQLIKFYVTQKNWSYDQFLVSSFDHYAVLKFHELLPEVPMGVIFECNPIGYADIAVRAGAQYAIMYYEFITPEFVSNAHQRNVQVFAFTVNDKETAQQLCKLSIDGIITNYPDVMNSSRSP